MPRFYILAGTKKKLKAITNMCHMYASCCVYGIRVFSRPVIVCVSFISCTAPKADISAHLGHRLLHSFGCIYWDITVIPQIANL